MKYLKFVFPVLFVILLGYLYSCNEIKDNGNLAVDPASVDKFVMPDPCVETHPCGITHCCMSFTCSILPAYGTEGVMTVTGNDCNGDEFNCIYDFVYGNNQTAMGNFVPSDGSYTFSARLEDATKIYTGSISFTLPGNYYPINLQITKK